MPNPSSAHAEHQSPLRARISLRITEMKRFKRSSPAAHPRSSASVCGRPHACQLRVCGCTPKLNSHRSCSSRLLPKPSRAATSRQAVVVGRYLADRPHRSAAAAGQRHRAAWQQRPGARLRSRSCRNDATGRQRNGTAVYSAHRDTHFRFLKDVVTGDEVRVTLRTGDTFRYRVSGTSVVRWDQSGIDPFADGRNLILATCWPLDATFPVRCVISCTRRLLT